MSGAKSQLIEFLEMPKYYELPVYNLSYDLLAEIFLLPILDIHDLFPPLFPAFGRECIVSILAEMKGWSRIIWIPIRRL